MGCAKEKQAMTTEADLEAGPATFFTTDHRASDALWADVEAAVDDDDSAAAQAAFVAFEAATRRHFAMEEEVLFPAFEKATGMTMGPTQVMRSEHEQMRGLLSQMALVAASDLAALVEHGDTLLMLTQQHNLKEEGMLYPMAEAHLGAEWPELARELRRYLAP